MNVRVDDGIIVFRMKTTRRITTMRIKMTRVKMTMKKVTRTTMPRQRMRISTRIKKKMRMERMLPPSTMK